MSALVKLDNPSEFEALFGGRLPPSGRFLAHPPEKWNAHTHWRSYKHAADILFRYIKEQGPNSGELAWPFVSICRHAIETVAKDVIWRYARLCPDSAANWEKYRPTELTKLGNLEKGASGHNLAAIGWYAGRVLAEVFPDKGKPPRPWRPIEDKLTLWHKADRDGHIFRYGRDQGGRRYVIGRPVNCLRPYGIMCGVTSMLSIAEGILFDWEADQRDAV